MSKNFNLLLLHSPTDRHPRSWVCIKGKKLDFLIKRLRNSAIKNQRCSANYLNIMMSNKFKCATNTIANKFNNQGKFYPIPIILELMKLSKDNRLKRDIRLNIEYLKINSASSKPLKAVNKLNNELAKILGAFMADGSLGVQVIFAFPKGNNLEKIKDDLEKLKIRHSVGRAPSRQQDYISIRINSRNINVLEKFIENLNPELFIQTHYNIELVDEYKDNILMFNKWIKKIFSIEPTGFYKERNAWRTIFSNKILARYLIKFFEVIPGPKTITAHEPKIIRRSNLEIRKDFAKGVLMFDGCATKGSRIAFSTKSLNLYNSLKEIWTKDKIQFGFSLNEKRKEWNLFTTSKNKIGKLLNYFEEKTQKHSLLNWLKGDLSYKPIIKINSHISTERILEILGVVKICDSSFLKGYFNCTHTTIRTYLKILQRQNKIKLTDKPSFITYYVNKGASIFLNRNYHNLLFNQIKNEFGNYNNFAVFMNIRKAALSAWKVKKNRIPIHIIKEACRILKLNFDEFSKNIKQVNQEIVEVI